MTEQGQGPLERGLTVLRALADSPEPRLRRSDLTKITGIPRSPVDRVLETLIQLGYVREEGRDALLAPGAMAPGNAYLASSPLRAALTGHVAQLANQLDESVSLAVPDRTAARLIDQAVRRRTMYLAFHIGGLLPAERTAAGVVLACDWSDEDFSTWRKQRAMDPLDASFNAVPTRACPPDEDALERDFTTWIRQARTDGWALDDEWVEPGLLALGAPVHAPDGTVAGAISVLTHTSRHTPESFISEVVPPLRAATTEMTAALTASPPTPGQPRVHPAQASELRLRKQDLGMGFLEGLARGLAVIEAFQGTLGGLTITAAAEATGLSRATARRNLLTLTALGYARLVGDTFQLQPAVMDLGFERLSPLTLADLATPHLRELAHASGQSASLAVLDGDDIRSIAKAAAPRVLRIDLNPGTRLPAPPTALGRVLLAGLPPSERAERLRRFTPQAYTSATLTSQGAIAEAVDTVSRDGYALVDQEFHEGIRSLAVPIHDSAGRTLAALNLTLHAGSSSADAERDELLPVLRMAARRIEADVALAFACAEPVL
ncbi:IclR family transcriptional regulator C-terminal domain-containing protein [Streptomyces sp. NBC_01092]|uniref:IclR family transcriptional regulator domain-containing protein n=1 Tax=Streptomyces sp. NBC_01092 TaxID=2903748 RepID=UPI003865309D|nr:helix-turn-helix domain-containing protein [Streptomyces sp. NBC_01092]